MRCRHISVKFGAMRDPGGAMIGFDARPAAVRNFLAYSLRRLGTDQSTSPGARRSRGADRGLVARASGTILGWSMGGRAGRAARNHAASSRSPGRCNGDAFVGGVGGHGVVPPAARAGGRRAGPNAAVARTNPRAQEWFRLVRVSAVWLDMGAFLPGSASDDRTGPALRARAGRGERDGRPVSPPGVPRACPVKRDGSVARVGHARLHKAPRRCFGPWARETPARREAVGLKCAEGATAVRHGQEKFGVLRRIVCCS